MHYAWNCTLIRAYYKLPKTNYFLIRQKVNVGSKVLNAFKDHTTLTCRLSKLALMEQKWLSQFP